MPSSKTLWRPATRPDLLAVLFLLASAAHALTWTTHGPVGGAATDVAFAASSPRVVYATNGAGVFRSDDAGDTWRDVSGPVARASHIAVDPTNPDVAYVAAAITHLYKTTDGGATWRDLGAALPSGVIPSAILIDPTNASTVYLGSRCGPIGFKGPPSPEALTGSPFAGAGLYKSTDAGATWVPKMNGLTDRSFGVCIEELSLDPASPQHLYASPVYSDGGDSQSFDGAETWTRAPAFVPSDAIADNPALPNVRYGVNGVTPKFLASSDSGVTWQEIGARGLPAVGVRTIAVDPETGRLFMGTDLGVYRSGDGGVDWLDAGAKAAPVSRIAVDRGAGFVFAAGGAGVQRMPLPLGPWTTLTLNDASSNVIRLAADPNDSATVFASGIEYGGPAPVFQHGRISVTHDRGASWQLVQEADNVFYSTLVVDGGHRLYVDAATAADPRRAGWIYRTIRASFTASFEYSRDAGASWTSTRLPFVSNSGIIAIDPSNPSTIYTSAGTGPGIARSSDAGVSWQIIYTGIDPGSTAIMQVAPSRSSTLYRAAYVNAAIGTCTNGGAYPFFRSDDGGVTWTRFSWPGQCASQPRAMAIDPRDARSVWVVSGNGRLFHTADGGETWDIPDQPPGSIISIGITDLAFSADGATLHAAVFGQGVWEAAIAGPRHRAAAH